MLAVFLRMVPPCPYIYKSGGVSIYGVGDTARLSTVGDRAFQVASARVWNELQGDWTIRTIDYSYHGLFVPRVDHSYHGPFVP